jgi:talin
MVTNVTSLLKTVKAVEDEHTRGTRALESTIEAIAQEIRVRAFLFHQVFLIFSFQSIV